MKKKILIVIGIVLVLSDLIMIFLIINNKDFKLKKHRVYKKKSLTKEEVFNGVKFSNIEITYDDGYTTFVSDVTNVSDNDISDDSLHITFKNKDNDVVEKLLIFIPEGLKIGETKTISATAKGNFDKIVDKEIVE